MQEEIFVPQDKDLDLAGHAQSRQVFAEFPLLIG